MTTKVLILSFYVTKICNINLNAWCYITPRHDIINDKARFSCFVVNGPFIDAVKTH